MRPPLYRRALVSTLASLVALSHCGGSTFTPGGEDASVDASSGSSDAGGTCDPACNQFRTCCNGTCVNTANDPLNCGGCGIACGSSTPFCLGSCRAAPCTVDSGTCGAGTTCCGSGCCDSTQICCQSEGPVGGGPACTTPTGSPATCPQGCAPLCISDRHVKHDVRAVDARAVLETLARVPMSTWSYNSDPPEVRHMGPMAQDFHSAFGLGDTDRAYDPIDAHGVAFAAIQGLYERLEEQDRRIERLARENEELRSTCR